MREIKCRGIDKLTGEWIIGYYGYKSLTDEHFIIVPTFDTSSSRRPEYFTDYLVIPESVGQYTGLKDKNGKEIYEGDIIFHHHREEEYRLQGVVRYEEQWAGFYFAGNRGMNTNTKYEVLGNIYENPDLIIP